MCEFFNKMMMNIILLFKQSNFSIIRKFYIDETKQITEYVYNSHKFFTDTWPPNTTTKGTPIKSVIRDDGKDITETVLKYAGPLKCYVNPISLNTFKKKLRLRLHILGVKILYEDVSEPFNGDITVTDILGKTRTIKQYNQDIIK